MIGEEKWLCDLRKRPESRDKEEKVLWKKEGRKEQINNR
jgi:hypothetical protein